MGRRLVFFALVLLISAGSLGAQDTTTRRPDREALQRRFQERFGEMVKRNLQLSDSQVVRLGDVNRRYEEQRRLLIQQERDVRMSLRDELLAQGQGRGNQERIAALLDRAIGVQKQRIELLESEQRELARFLNPAQRARLLGMQEQLRRNAGEIRSRGIRRPPGQPGMAPGMRERMRERLRESGPPARRPPRPLPPPSN